MLINKITTGFVIQTFDTGTGKYIDQEFYASEQVDYESTDGQTPIEDEFMESVNFGPYAEQEPYLPFDMVQPLAVENCREQIQEDLLALIDGQSQQWPEIRTIACQIVVNNFKKFFQK